MHLNEEQIQRLLHGEVDARSKETLSQHVAGCEACARLLADAEREERAIFDLLSRVDHPAPRVDAGSFAPKRGTLTAWERWAAVIVVVAALGGAAYAIPGSPLPALWKQFVETIGSDDSPPPNERLSVPPGRATSGISVPVTPRFRIFFAVEEPEGVVAVSLTDEPNIVVRALGGTATFTTDADRLTIGNRDSAADYEIEIPRDAPFVEVSIGARQILLKDGGTFAPGLATDERGRYVFSLSTPDH